MVDFVALANSAKTLVDANGRSVTINKFDTTPADSDKPWRGANDPRAVPNDTATLIASFVPLSSATKLGLTVKDDNLLKMSQQVMIIAPGSAFTKTLENFNEVVDGSSTWKIIFVEVLKPAATLLLYFIGVAR